MLLFISDLHLDADRPGTAAAFYRFLEQEAVKAKALYILGDLFELWVGDDDDSALVLEVRDHLQQLAQAGTGIYFQHGNRDFLLGEGFAHAAGMELLPEIHQLELNGERILLMHGDTLCIDDHEYQAFRQQVRQPQWIATVLDRPLAERRALGQQLREQSQSMSSRKSEDIMDVAESEVQMVMAQYQASKLIHGHTHRPARHPLANGERIVLGDWDELGWALRHEAGVWTLESWAIEPS